MLIADGRVELRGDCTGRVLLCLRIDRYPLKLRIDDDPTRDYRIGGGKPVPSVSMREYYELQIRVFDDPAP